MLSSRYYLAIGQFTVRIENPLVLGVLLRSDLNETQELGSIFLSAFSPTSVPGNGACRVAHSSE